MKCPFCSNVDTQVKDSRASEDNMSIRRRRVCVKCEARFTTMEELHLKPLYIKKRSGNIQSFDRQKLQRSIIIALRKRPVTSDAVDRIVSNIVYTLEGMKSNTVSSVFLGEMVMEKLAKTDKVAYVRFASVYMNFENVEDFANVQ